MIEMIGGKSKWTQWSDRNQRASQRINYVPKMNWALWVFEALQIHIKCYVFMGNWTNTPARRHSERQIKPNVIHPATRTVSQSVILFRGQIHIMCVCLSYCFILILLLLDILLACRCLGSPAPIVFLPPISKQQMSQ